MKIENFFTNKSKFKINWDLVWSIPEFEVLRETPQSKKWHKEGCVATHTQMVVNEAIKGIPSSKENMEFKTIMVIAALFHDIGKGVHPYFNPETEDWSSLNHAEEGEMITRRILWNENPFIRETICYFVKNHMKPLYILDNTDSSRELIKLSCEPLYPKYCNIKNLCLLKKFDNLGSIFDDDSWIEKLEFTKSLAEELGCFDCSFHFVNSSTKWDYLNVSIKEKPNFVEEKFSFNAYITIGTDYKTDDENVAVITKDNCDDVFEAILELCDYEKDFVININDLEDYDIEKIIETIFYYEGKTIFVYGSDMFQQYLSSTLCFDFINKN